MEHSKKGTIHSIIALTNSKIETIIRIDSYVGI